MQHYEIFHQHSTIMILWRGESSQLDLKTKVNERCILKVHFWFCVKINSEPYDVTGSYMCQTLCIIH